MEERAFRLDFYIAIGALIVSVLTMGTLVYQTRIIEDQYSAAIWPYVGIESAQVVYPSKSYEISLTNNGLGPALIRAARLSIDGKPVAGWDSYESMVVADQVRDHIKGNINFTMSSVDRTTAIRPSETLQVLLVKLAPNVPLDLPLRHKISLDLCYCSLNGRCWDLRDTSGTSPGNLPTPVDSCPSDEHIGA